MTVTPKGWTPGYRQWTVWSIDQQMGRLSGFRYQEVARRLRRAGYRFDRTGPGSHEVWRHEGTGRKVTLPRHSGDMAEGTLRAILREAGIEVRDFLGTR